MTNEVNLNLTASTYTVPYLFLHVFSPLRKQNENTFRLKKNKVKKHAKQKQKNSFFTPILGKAPDISMLKAYFFFFSFRSLVCVGKQVYLQCSYSLLIFFNSSKKVSSKRNLMFFFVDRFTARRGGAGRILLYSNFVFPLYDQLFLFFTIFFFDEQYLFEKS